MCNCLVHTLQWYQFLALFVSVPLFVVTSSTFLDCSELWALATDAVICFAPYRQETTILPS